MGAPASTAVRWRSSSCTDDQEIDNAYSRPVLNSVWHRSLVVGHREHRSGGRVEQASTLSRPAVRLLGYLYFEVLVRLLERERDPHTVQRRYPQG